MKRATIIAATREAKYVIPEWKSTWLQGDDTFELILVKMLMIRKLVKKADGKKEIFVSFHLLSSPSSMLCLRSESHDGVSCACGKVMITL